MTTKNKDEGWLWLLCRMPTFGGDVVFQAQVESIEQMGERLRVRYLSSIQYGKNKTSGAFECRIIPWMPENFSLINPETEIVIDLGKCPIEWMTDQMEDKLIDEVTTVWEHKTITPANEKLMDSEVKAEEARKKMRIVTP